jgi:putative FmdB family regulatory protein
MPIFDYQCESCGYVFDALQKLGEAALSDCPTCGQAGLKKLLSAPHVHLKHGAAAVGSPGVGQGHGQRPRVGHTFDSPTPHSHDHDHQHCAAADHGHKHKH